MIKERKRIALKSLSLNTGQIDWLPRNPRQWTKEAMRLMMKSLDEDSDFIEDRPPLVVENPNKPGDFVVFGGNLRIEGEKKRKVVKELDCVLYIVEDTSVDRDTIIRRSMKDNGTFGDYDWDIIANEWDGLPLTDWGVPAWNTEEGDNEDEGIPDDLDKPQGETKPNVVKITFPDEDSLNRFMGMYQEELRQMFKCNLSINGGNA